MGFILCGNVHTNVGPIYIGEWMVSKNLPHGYENCNTNQILILGRYVRVRGSLYTRIIIWINNHSKPYDTRVILQYFAPGKWESTKLIFRLLFSWFTQNQWIVKKWSPKFGSRLQDVCFLTSLPTLLSKIELKGLYIAIEIQSPIFFSPHVKPPRQTREQIPVTTRGSFHFWVSNISAVWCWPTVYVYFTIKAYLPHCTWSIISLPFAPPALLLPLSLISKWELDRSFIITTLENELPAFNIKSLSSNCLV